MAKKWLVIDAHTHFLPEEAVKKAVETRVNLANLMIGKIPATIQKTKEIETMLRIWDEAGVDMGVLYQSQWNLLGLTICQELNNGYARIKRTYPGRFILCGTVPLQPGQDVVDEVERCISVFGFSGIALSASSPDYSLDSPELWPMYQKINQLSVPIVIHPSIMASMWGGGAKYELRSTVTREYEIAKSVVEVMFGVLKDFPDLKFLFSHYGGGMPALKARVRAWFQPDNWNIPDSDESKNNGKSPRELDEFGLSRAFDTLFDKLYFDMAGAGAGWLPMINAALAVLRTDRMCFGTDYPFDVRVAKDTEYFIDTVKALKISDADKQLMLGGNIKRLFKMG